MNMSHGAGGNGPGSNNTRTRSLVEGALFAALTSLFALLGLVPALFFLQFAIPVPLTIVGYRYGLRTATLSASVALVVTFIISGNPIAVGMVLSFGVIGLVIAYGVRRSYPAVRTVLLATGASFVSLVGDFLFALWVLGINQWTEFLSIQEEATKRSLEFQRSLTQKMPGFFSPAQFQLFETQTREFMKMVPRLWPFFIVAGSFLLGVINYGIIRASFKRLKLGEVPAFPPFRAWRLPEWVGWAGVAAFVAGYADAVWHLTGAGLAWNNLSYLCLYAFLIEGLSVAWYYFDRWRWDKATRWLAVVFGFLALKDLVIWIVGAIGFFDIFLNYRKPREGGV